MDQGKTSTKLDSLAPTQSLNGSGGNEVMKLDDLFQATDLSVSLKSKAIFNDITKASRITSRCILYKFPPENRKLIFNIVLETFFEEYQELRELRYGGGKSMVRHERVFGGLGESWLPGLEIALFPDANLFGEFITTRVEASALILVPEITVLGAFEDRGIKWRNITSIPALVRKSIPVVVYQVGYV
jgi:hypothetical protein